MAEYSYTCQYCGQKFTRSHWSEKLAKEQKCPICNDCNLKVKSFEETKEDGDPFGYEEG